MICAVILNSIPGWFSHAVCLPHVLLAATIKSQHMITHQSCVPCSILAQVAPQEHLIAVTFTKN